MNATVTASTIWAPGTTTTSAADSAAQVVISDPLPVDLYVYRGDSGRFRVSITDADGAPLNISTATWDCDVRSTHDAQTVIATFTVDTVDASTVEVGIDALTSALLIDQSVWDLEMTLDGEVQTLLAGVVHVHKDVSRP